METESEDESRLLNYTDEKCHLHANLLLLFCGQLSVDHKHKPNTSQ